MIKLVVEPYCHECQKFEAKSKTEVLVAWNNVAMINTSFVDTTVTCAYADECQKMYAYLTEQHTKELLKNETPTLL